MKRYNVTAKHVNTQGCIQGSSVVAHDLRIVGEESYFPHMSVPKNKKRGARAGVPKGAQSAASSSARSSPSSTATSSRTAALDVSPGLTARPRDTHKLSASCGCLLSTPDAADEEDSRLFRGLLIITT